jgi:hypothetical protein
MDRAPSPLIQPPSATPTRLPARGVLQRQCACGKHAPGGECEECRKKREATQRRAVGRPGGAGAGYGGAVEPPALGSGRALAPRVAERFRPGLGSLVDRVRVHDDERGARYAESVDAVAVTTGRDIAFARGAFRPATDAGRGLLAHELAHVHQQHGPDGPPAGYLSKPGDRWERAADRFAATASLPGGAGALSAAASPGVVQAAGGTFGGFWSKIGRTLGSIISFGAWDPGFSESVLRDYLDVLAAGSIENDFDSDNKARDVVRKRATLGPFTTDVKRLLVEEMLTGATLGDDEDAIIALLRDTPRPERMRIVGTIGRERLWSNFSWGNRRTIEGLTLEVSDFQQAGTVSRLSGLSASDLRDYRAASDDPAVQAEIDKLLALESFTTPLAETSVGLGFTLGGAGEARFPLNGFEVTVQPDGRDASLRNFANTNIEMQAAGPANVTVDTATPDRPVVSFTPPTPITVHIQTVYGPEASRSITTDGGAGYGRGTTPGDKQAGRTSLRFHESHHGRDFIEFLGNHPAPTFTGTTGMSQTDFEQAVTAYQAAVTDYQTRIAEFSVRRTDCPGTSISGDVLSRFGLRATICKDAP